jgi:hypothetical protein
MNTDTPEGRRMTTVPDRQGDVEGLVEGLQRWARIAAAESVDGLSPEDTLYWKAASLLLSQQAEIEALKGENARLREGGFAGKDGLRWVRKDDRDEALSRAEKAERELAEAREEADRYRDGWNSAQEEWRKLKAVYTEFCADLGCKDVAEVAHRLQAAEAAIGRKDELLRALVRESAFATGNAGDGFDAAWEAAHDALHPQEGKR